jgi:hypothetical protein
MTASQLSRMKIVGVLRIGAILEVNKIPGGLAQRGFAWGASFSGSPGAFLSHPSLGVNYFQSN